MTRLVKNAPRCGTIIEKIQLGGREAPIFVLSAKGGIDGKIIGITGGIA